MPHGFGMRLRWPQGRDEEKSRAQGRSFHPASDPSMLGPQGPAAGKWKLHTRIQQGRIDKGCFRCPLETEVRHLALYALRESIPVFRFIWRAAPVVEARRQMLNHVDDQRFKLTLAKSRKSASHPVPAPGLLPADWKRLNRTRRR